LSSTGYILFFGNNTSLEHCFALGLDVVFPSLTTLLQKHPLHHIPDKFFSLLTY